jgi:magnesium chelatase family protein
MKAEFDASDDIVLCIIQLNLLARTFHRTLKLSRTIADMAGSEEIQSTHVAEAKQYHPKITI